MGERRLVLVAISLALFGGLLVGCKPHGPRAPRRDVSGMNVDEIERQLALNREDLEAAGVWVPEPAPAEPPPSAAPPATEPEPEPPPDEGGQPTEDQIVQQPGATDAEPDLASAPEPLDRPALDVSSRRRRGRVDREVRRESRTRCDRICDLADVTCDLMDQICALAARHPHDVRYHAACERAELQCDAAARECELCSD